MKPALYYAIMRNLHNDVVAITSEKTGRRSGWAGRYVRDNTPTHGTFGGFSGGIMGRFDSAEAAEAKRKELAQIAADYEARRKPHQEATTRLYNQEREAIEAACRSVQS